MSLIEDLQEECEYDPEGDSPIDNLIAYKDALEDRLGYAEEEIAVALRCAENEVARDLEYWTELATGQDSEEAEASGALEGRVTGLEEALGFIRGEAACTQTSE